MRIALTGASSTGKTTLAHALMKSPSFVTKVGIFLPSEGRRIVNHLRFGTLDEMDETQRMLFQMLYFTAKLSAESARSQFITDRSFVDVAAYWTVRDADGMDDYLNYILDTPCRALAQNYDLHIYLPMGTLPFEHDGQRSTDIDFHTKIDRRIEHLLTEWNLPFRSIQDPDINLRVHAVLEAISLQCDIENCRTSYLHAEGHNHG